MAVLANGLLASGAQNGMTDMTRLIIVITMPNRRDDACNGKMTVTIGKGLGINIWVKQSCGLYERISTTDPKEAPAGVIAPSCCSFDPMQAPLGDAYVTCVCFLTSGSKDTTVRIWDGKSCLHTLQVDIFVVVDSI